jgi:septum formation protein
MTPTPCRLILASASPRRREILARAGYAFETFDPGEVEDGVNDAPTPEDLAREKAVLKARHAAEALRQKLRERTLVVGVDTVAALGGDVLGKPLDRPDAIRILSRLSGTRHRVISGFCVLAAGPEAPRIWSGCDVTWVMMKNMPPEAIRAYVDSGEADGKAGAYAIQENGDRYVEKLEGSFLNVVGFPLEAFEAKLPVLFETWGWR